MAGNETTDPQAWAEDVTKPKIVAMQSVKSTAMALI
jgi:hypothetical protein